jgi:hypothetical protein
MARTYEIKDVPESNLKAEMELLKQDGATEVTSKKQDNGMYTITAIYPE